MVFCGPLKNNPTPKYRLSAVHPFPSQRRKHVLAYYLLRLLTCICTRISLHAACRTLLKSGARSPHGLPRLSKDQRRIPSSLAHRSDRDDRLQITNLPIKRILCRRLYRTTKTGLLSGGGESLELSGYLLFTHPLILIISHPHLLFSPSLTFLEHHEAEYHCQGEGHADLPLHMCFFCGLQECYSPICCQYAGSHHKGDRTSLLRCRLRWYLVRRYTLLELL